MDRWKQIEGARGGVPAVDGLSDRLRQARIKAGYETAADFARHIGKAVPTYIHHENGTRRPKWPQVRHYAEILDVDAAWLWAGDAQSEIRRKGVPAVDWDSIGPDGKIRGTVFSHFPAYSDNCIGIRVKDNSQNKVAKRGDFIIVDTSDHTLKEGMYFVVYHRSALKFIKFGVIAGEPSFIFDGSRTKTVPISLPDVKVIGRVIQSHRSL